MLIPSIEDSLVATIYTMREPDLNGYKLLCGEEH